MPDHPYPSWFYLGRAILAAVVGLAVIWHEATSDAQVVLLIAGLLLVGIFAPTDVAAWRSTGGGQNVNRSSD